LGILFDPKSCEICENSFCGHCIVEWLRRSSECPFKCFNASFKDSGRVLKTFLNKLILSCEKCNTKSIKYERYKSHYLACNGNVSRCFNCGEKVNSCNIKYTLDNFNKLTETKHVLDNKLKTLEDDYKSLNNSIKEQNNLVLENKKIREEVITERKKIN